MAKLATSPITDMDLLDFVKNDSDFGFEMQVLSQLRESGFLCSHSGTYRDPISEKIRQFDIRAHSGRGNQFISLAVECKNLRPNNPLLLSSVPRSDAEAFHDLILWNVGGNTNRSSVRSVSGSKSFYKPGEMVGEKTDQVGREATSRDLVSNDEATFEKLNQAINSCHDLVREQVKNITSPSFMRAIVPVLVLPTGLLWQVDYDQGGNMKTAPYQIARSTLFFNHTWSVPGFLGETLSYRLSHLEIITFEGLRIAADLWFGPHGLFMI